MKLDNTQDQKILLHLVESAHVPVSEAEVFLDLRDRIQEAEIEEPSDRPIVAPSLSLEEARTKH